LIQFQSLLAAADARPVKAALIGAGEFGMSLIAQSRSMRGLEIVAVVDRHIDAVAARLSAAGIPAQHVARAAELPALAAAGVVALAGNADAVLGAPVEMLVEATGDAEFAARHALLGIERGIAVTMVSKEAECVVGPVLAAKARARGVAYNLVNGDQPALLVSLISWARVLGLKIVAAGKSSEYDYVWDTAAATVTWTDKTVHAAGLDKLWSLGPDRAATVAQRARLLSNLPQRTVPDFCEMTLVANATGLSVDRPDFHAPLTRTTELPELYIPRTDGGLLDRTGVIDVFNCLRRTDDASFAGGVFIVVSWPDTTTGLLMRGKGIPTSPDGRYGLIYNPSHLLGVEAPLSMLAALRLGNSMLDDSYRPVADLVARAEYDLPAGHKLEIVGLRHAVPGLRPEMLPARAAKGNAPCPYYLAVGRTLTRPAPQGALITVDCLDLAASSSILATLRAEQDALFSLASGEAG
jgi:predicted homoserine dehydrogenase-like protein